MNSSITSTLLKKETSQSSTGAGENLHVKMKQSKKSSLTKSSTMIHEREPKKYIPVEEEKIR